MFNSFSPLGGMFGAMALPSPDDADISGQQTGRSFRDRNAAALMPFGFGRSLFPNMDDMFANFNQLSQNPNCHSYSSSTVMTYTTDESGRPQMYQASSSTRTAPGGVKETRKAVQDTRTGVQQMAIGHHLNERAHIVEKKKNRYTGDEEENHELVNLEDDDADTFDNEWQRKAQSYASRPTYASVDGSRWRERSPARPAQPQMLAITDGSSEKPRKQKRVKHSSPSHKPGQSRGRPTPYE